MHAEEESAEQIQTEFTTARDSVFHHSGAQWSRYSLCIVADCWIDSSVNSVLNNTFLNHTCDAIHVRVGVIVKFLKI
jgi:hypothetical protein